MPVVQINFGRSAMEIARANIHDDIVRVSENMLAGHFTEAQYKFNAGFAQGLQKALEALTAAETEAQKEN